VQHVSAYAVVRAIPLVNGRVIFGHLGLRNPWNDLLESQSHKTVAANSIKIYIGEREQI